MRAGPPVAVIGLDCGTPGLLFDRYADDMPTLSALMRRGLRGPLRSTVPPITVPAWSCMMSGYTPGELGIYGFRNRRDHSYDALVTASSKSVRVPRLWDLATLAGQDSIVIAVPGTFPPSPIRGEMVSCFLTPSLESGYTHPPELRDEVRRITGGYTLDVVDFRTDDKHRVARDIFDMSEQRFRLARHFATTRSWDFFMFVDISPDRLHHAFWKYCDPAHPRHEPGNRYANVFREYYRSLDHHLAEFLEVLPDDTVVLIVSDHGGQPMVGGFCFNEWLVDRNLLVLADQPDRPVSLHEAKVELVEDRRMG